MIEKIIHDPESIVIANAISETALISSEASSSKAEDDPVYEFALSVARGLSDTPKRLDCRFLYDAAGSEIFERITEQPEYYLTRVERAILAKAAPLICEITGEVTLIELGSGSSAKTQLLLEAYAGHFGTVCYTPVDISRSILEHAEEEITSKFPSVKVDPLHGTYDEAFPLFSKLSPSMLLFLGSTVGNLDASESTAFWNKVTSHMMPGDFCLLGIDTTRDAAVINAAYNDAAGYSSAFTRNLFSRMNRELGSAIDVDKIDHVAFFDAARSRVEIFAEFRERQEIRIEPLSRSFTIEAGQRILTEISRKFHAGDMVSYLSTFGLITRRIHTDGAGQFAVILLEKV